MRLWPFRMPGMAMPNPSLAVAVAPTEPCLAPEEPAPGDQDARQPTSQVLRGLLGHAAPEHITLDWLIDGLRDRSFGLIVLLITLVGMLPGVATFTGLLLLVPATQMILARPAPVLPRTIAKRRFPARKVTRLVRLAAGLFGWLERYAGPRWTTPEVLTKRVVGVAVLVMAISLQSPLPFSQIIPNFVIMMIAFSYLVADGLLLMLSLALMPVSLGITGAAIWGTAVAAGLL